MKFWDSSAILPLLVNQRKQTALSKRWQHSDSQMVVWTASKTEVVSAICRLRRENRLDDRTARLVLGSIETLFDRANTVTDYVQVREIAHRLLWNYPLRAADSLQLGAALVWCQNRPKKYAFLTHDENVSAAAAAEGFSI